MSFLKVGESPQFGPTGPVFWLLFKTTPTMHLTPSPQGLCPQVWHEEIQSVYDFCLMSILDCKFSLPQVTMWHLINCFQFKDSLSIKWEHRTSASDSKEHFLLLKSHSRGAFVGYRLGKPAKMEIRPLRNLFQPGMSIFEGNLIKAFLKIVFNYRFETLCYL